MKTFADRILNFNKNLHYTGKLPKGIKVMNPFRDNPQILPISSQFYNKFYNNNKQRHIILGINPGRFGAGSTGVPFNDTKLLKEKCGIVIKEFQTHEPSAVFVYEVIEKYGGVKKFYSDFYINSICPLGFTKKGENRKDVNYNYYDSKELANAAYGFIIETLKKQIKLGIKTDVCFCFGTGKNFKFLTQINNENNFFSKIVPLEHPRYIMQYKHSSKSTYVNKYIKEFNKI
jgi:hypothetical protein